ncbi:hypothetical protein [Vibrio coralliilyticus]|uniref:hypothetical protein n=1 Tax=Vibrio coralliilyticus TaxID=190893 RepID=UPI0015D47E6B|nr:hypothetical protein [Vibrio coralliilyticus]
MDVLIISEYPLICTTIRNTIVSICEDPKILACSHPQASKLYRRHQVKHFWSQGAPDLILLDTDSKLSSERDIEVLCSQLYTGSLFEKGGRLVLLSNDRKLGDVFGLECLDKPFSINQLREFVKPQLKYVREADLRKLAS